MRHKLRIFSFWNQSDMGEVNAMQDVTRIYTIKNRIRNISTYNMPIFLEK